MLSVSGTCCFAVVLHVLSVGIRDAHGQVYYGKEIQSGWGNNPMQSLAGVIYAVDKDTFQVIGFTFDATGNGGDSVFLLGTNDNVANGGTDNSALIIANPLGQNIPLKSYNNENVVLELPSGRKLTDYKYIAVGDRNTKELYGSAAIAAGFDFPAPKQVGQFVSRAHGVRSGDVTILNDRMIQISKFRYDGQGPDAYFYVGVTENVVAQVSPYGVIPDENGVSSRKARAYSDSTIVLLLPPEISVRKLRWLSMYCVAYDHNFGEVKFAKNANVPPYTETAINRTGLNCEPMNDRFQVAWLASEGSISIELAGDIDRDTDYMAFGLSGSDSGTSMIGADVIVADWKQNRSPRAVDYHITEYSQCADNGGACPDNSTYNGGNDDVREITGQISNGIVRVRFERALITNEIGTKDKEYKTDGTKQHIAWAIGPLNTNDETAKHYVGDRTSGAMTIDFGRDPVDNCPLFAPPVEVIKPNFTAHHLYGREQTVFTVEIGQAGSEQGYKAITGLPSWGIAWYINGILVPELHLKRGVSYTFRVGGGTDPSAGSKYHPLYFTDDREGGYEQASAGRIFPGTVDGQTADIAVGGYCEWKLTSAAVKSAEDGRVYECFEQFKDDLYLDCDSSDQGYADFIFTPDSSTPDLVYYQCYTHKNLGWKVNVYDELPIEEIKIDGCSAGPRSTSTAGVVTLLTLAMAYYLI